MATSIIISRGMGSSCSYLLLNLQHWSRQHKIFDVNGHFPVARSSHASVCLNYGEERPQIFISGGKGNEGKVLGDVWILDVMSGNWTEVSWSYSVVQKELQLLFIFHCMCTYK